MLWFSHHWYIFDTAYPLISVSDQADSTKGRHPSLELIHPVVEGGLGNQHHVRTRDVSVVLHITQQCNSLESLTQSLTIRKENMNEKKKQKKTALWHDKNICNLTPWISRNVKKCWPFHRRGYRWFHSRTKKWASSDHGPDSPSSSLFSHLHYRQENKIL